MPQEIEITCGEGADAYQVTLTAGSLKTFYTASQDPRVKGKLGESLVAAFRVAAIADGMNNVDQFEGLTSIVRTKASKRNDGPNGEAAVEELWDNGALQLEVHYFDGKRNDTRDGIPALRSFNPDGGAGMVKHYRDDKLHDGPNGEPAVLQFLKGELILGKHYQDDVPGEDLTAAEIRAVNRPSREHMTRAISAAFPGLRILAPTYPP